MGGEVYINKDVRYPCGCLKKYGDGLKIDRNTATKIAINEAISCMEMASNFLRFAKKNKKSKAAYGFTKQLIIFRDSI